MFSKFKISKFFIFSILHLIKQTAGQIDILDAELLIAHVLKQDRAFVVAHPEYLVTRAQTHKSTKLIQKRKAGVPIAYLTGHKEFYGLDFFVNKHTLIPRPETEVLIDLVINKLQIFDCRFQNTMLIDVGTGSGCIPISILKTITRPNPKSEIRNLPCYSVDISRSALRVAKKNAKKHGVNITFLHGDLLAPIYKKSAICNLQSAIILTANLPYLTEEQYKTSPTPEIHHEPRTALVAQDKGLGQYKKLLNQLHQYSLFPPKAPAGRTDRDPPLADNIQYNTTCFFEIDPAQSVPLSQYANALFPHATINIHQDLSGDNRVFIMRLGG